jgi:threonine/homoserine/homoserine lactone efflux protein
MESNALTLLSHGVIVYILAPVIILLLVSVRRKEVREGQPLKGILWFGVAMMALCAVVILFTTLHRATALGRTNRIEVTPSQVR